MEIWQLRTFQVVAETLNFTRAAERLKMTQSAVSHQMKALETELGESLFVRARRGVKLSGAGQAMLEHAQRILEEVDALRQHVAGRRHGPTGRVRAAAATQAFAYLFAPLCEAFIHHHPGIDVSFITAGSTAQTVASIQSGEAHVGIASLPVAPPALAVTELFSDELLAVVPSAHPLARHKVVAPARLRGEPVVLFESGSSIRHLTDGFMKKARWAPRVALESNDMTFVKLMVAHGRGISFLPPWAVREEVLGGRLAVLRIEGHRLRRTVAMVALARYQSAALRAFLDFMSDHRPQLQWMAEGHTAVRLRERPQGSRMRPTNSTTTEGEG
jgi:LysR family transcriptional activator of glutamate synthase operon